MQTFYVRYTAYEKDSTFVLAEGIMPVTCSMSNQAEATVKSMFQGSNVIIHSVNNQP